MNREQTIEQLKKIIKPYVENEYALGNLSETTDFIRDLNINSANLVDVILDIEDLFDITIDNQAMEKMVNVKSALDIIETQIATK